MLNSVVFKLFFNDSLEPRSGCRFVLFAAVFVAMWAVAGLGISIMLPDAEPSLLAALWPNVVAMAIASVLSLAFMARFVDRIPVQAFGVGFHERWPRDLGLGVALAASMLAAFMGASALVGGLTLEAEAGLSAQGLAVMLVLLVAAANEEILFRGYPLQVLMVGVGRWPGIVVMSTVFGLGHLTNPGATWLGTANTVLAGILLCLAYVRTRSLWFPFGIHIGWNLAMGPILGFPLSGLELTSVWSAEAGGPAWLTGGGYGPEAGLLATGVMSTAIVAVAATKRMAPSPRLESLLARYAGKV